MDYKRLGVRIREERQRLKLTQASLAEAVDISDTYMGAIERGERSLTLDTLVRLVNRLGVTIDYLLADYVSESDSNILEQFKQIIDGQSLVRKQMAIDVVRTIYSHLENDTYDDISGTSISVYTREALRQEYQKGNRFTYLFFWEDTTQANGYIGPNCLSQWWIQPFEIEGIVYSCALKYMMAEKARLFGDSNKLNQIMQAKSPKDMKAYGREIKRFDKYLWERSCYNIVKKANKAKFSQNPDLLEFLLGTGHSILVGASLQDRIWGIGMGKNDPDAENPMKWRGRNLLGFALTEVRDELRKEAQR